MKIGIDFHGVIDANPKGWTELIYAYVNEGHKVFIMTGARYSTFLHQCAGLKLFDLMGLVVQKKIEFFSISDYHSKHNPDKIDLSKPDNPHMEDKELWDKTKANFAREIELDMMIDDNKDYVKYFTTPCVLWNKDMLF